MLIQDNSIYINLCDDIWIRKKIDDKYVINNSKNKISFSTKENLINIEISEYLIKIEMDCIKSIPLFYAFEKNIFYLSDDIKIIIDKINCNKLNPLAITEYLHLKNCIDNKTFFKEIKLIQAGEIVEFNLNDKKILKYNKYTFRNNDKIIYNYTEFSEKYYNLSSNIFNNLYHEIKNKQIVIPLSGGFDSRFIISILHELGAKKNILAFSYGLPNNIESEISRSIAKKLGIKWFFIEYKSEEIEKIINSEIFLNFLLFSFNFSIQPHEQDFFAIKKLLKNKIIDNNSIIIPGHSGDFLAGSRIHLESELNNKNLIDSIYFFHSLRLSKNKYIFTSIEKKVNEIKNNNKNIDFMDIFEIFDWKERQAKYIINSLKVYEFFNLSWRVPLWDIEYFKFWSKCDNKIRKNKIFYDKFLIENYFKKYGIDYKINDNKSNFRNFIKKIIPKNIYIHLFKLMKYYKKNNYDDKLFNNLNLENILEDKRTKTILKNFGYLLKGKDINSLFSDIYINLLYKKYLEKFDFLSE